MPLPSPSSLFSWSPFPPPASTSSPHLWTCTGLGRSHFPFVAVETLKGPNQGGLEV